MTITPLQKHQWPLFLRMARQEGWRISATESRLYRDESTHPFLCLQQEGKVRGFISGVRHEHEAWIGNLIVDGEQRGKGYGAQLFDALVAQLNQHSCTSLWLTASADGQPLYKKRGFVAVDRIERWRAPGLGCIATECRQWHYLSQLDNQQHRHNRSSFLRTIGHNGSIVRHDNNVALLQPGNGLTVLGPWYEQGRQPQLQYQFLFQARRTCSRTHQLVADVFASEQLQRVLSAAGFTCCGSTTLMHYGSSGTRQPSTPRLQRSLAGLGSFN